VLRTSQKLADLGLVLLALPLVELGRWFRGPSRLVAGLRLQGRGSRARSLAGRRELRRTIASLDAHLPGGGNCYRRALVEMALDPGAAEERLYLGLKARGGFRSGHAWLASWPDAAKAGTYDAVLEM
jgi:hypothetical protein